MDTFDNENLMLSARNLQRAKVVNSLGLNIYDLLYHEKLVLSQAAIEELEATPGAKQEKMRRRRDDRKKQPRTEEGCSRSRSRQRPQAGAKARQQAKKEAA